MSQKLKLRAESADDLVVISSALQDAILKVGEITYNPKGRFMSLRLSRFRHESDDKAERVETGLRVDSVLGVKSRLIDRTDPDAFAVLLSCNFTKKTRFKKDPEGEIVLVFAGGGEISIEVECVDLTLADISAGRVTDKLPIHYDG